VAQAGGRGVDPSVVEAGGGGASDDVRPEGDAAAVLLAAHDLEGAAERELVYI